MDIILSIIPIIWPIMPIIPFVGAAAPLMPAMGGGGVAPALMPAMPPPDFILSIPMLIGGLAAGAAPVIPGMAAPAGAVGIDAAWFVSEASS
jgi:hypothetical protein